MKRLFLALLAIALCVAPAAAQSQPLQLIDLTGEFDAAWQATKDLPEADRPAAFKARFAKVLPGFYTEARTGQAAERYDARLAMWLKAWPEQRPVLDSVAQRFDGMFRPALSSFEARFGPMRGYPPIYLVHSLGEFDGGTRSLPQGTVLLFGADMIAKYHSTGEVQPFFHHELFHIYHFRTFKECGRVWCDLWSEGLATYVAKTLNPSASDTELLLTMPEPIRPEVEANRQAAVCAVVARLDSAEAADTQALFSFRRMGPGLPPRFGYYVGALAAAEMGRDRTPQQLAQMPAGQVRVELEKALRGLATCP